jgi:hypothetical protein
VTLTIGGSASTTMTVVNTNADAKLSMPRIGLPKGRTPSGLSPIDFAAVFPFGVGACLASLARRRNNRRTGEKPRRSSQIRLLLALLCTVGVLSVVGCSCLTSVYNVYTIPVTGTDTTGTIVQTTGTSPNSASPTLTVAQQQ